jgi:hypothetical protein
MKCKDWKWKYFLLMMKKMVVVKNEPLEKKIEKEEKQGKEQGDREKIEQEQQGREKIEEIKLDECPSLEARIVLR